MSRKNVYLAGRQEFLDYLSSRDCPTGEKDPKLDMYNRQVVTEMLCDMADSLASIAEDMKSTRKEIEMIRRRLAR